MGYLTTVTLYNDAMHEFRKNPTEFAEALFEGIDRANRQHREVSVGFNGYANYISVQPSFHATEHQVYLHSGNCVVNLNPYRQDMEELIKRNPELAEELVKRAQFLLTEAKKNIKKAKDKKKLST